MKESKVLKGIVLTAAVVAFSFPAIAAADGGETIIGKSEKVAYADLNVQKEAGAKQLYRRLQHASKRVCGVESLKVVGSISVVSQENRCYRATLDSAVAKVNNTAVTEIHEG
jgi:UrcA family protein